MLVACGGNDVDPRVIPGGGIGDGAIDGEVNVHIIDDQDNPIANATVSVGGEEKDTDENGLVVFDGVEGRQTIAVLAADFRSVVWVGVNGANVTIPMTPLGGTTAIEQATLSGSIVGWDTITPDAGHGKAAAVLYSQTDALGDDANNLQTPNQANICGFPDQPVCNWQLTSRTGTVTVIAAVIDRDTNGTLADPNDDITTITGWATRPSLTVEDGINQTGIELELVEAGNLQDVTIDLGAPPAGLLETAALVGIEVGADEVIQLPVFLLTDTDALLAPRPSVFAADATYRLTAIAQTTAGDLGAQSIQLVRGQAGADLVAGAWLVPPTGVVVTNTDASWEPVAGALLHQVSYEDDFGETILEVTVFDNSTQITIPALVQLAGGEAVAARVAGLGATLDPDNFSLDEDEDTLFAIAAEPTDL
jgi:hypothetical protein